MINSIKSKLPYNIKKVIRSIYPFNRSNPYTCFQPSFDQFNVSDFFLFRCDNFETVFVAENNLALLSAKPVECKHIFYFFTSSGNNCGKFEVSSSLFHYELQIDSQMTGGELIGSFIHQTVYSNESLKKESALILNQLIFQNRGYSGYKRKDSNYSNYSFLHGNFGSMYIHNGKLSSLSRQRSAHYYSPQIIIKIDKLYEFYFINPTNKKLNLSIFLKNNSNNSSNSENVEIPPMGLYKYDLITSLENEICNISWKTNLPVGRAIVFENNDLLFDVFHS